MTTIVKKVSELDRERERAGVIEQPGYTSGTWTPTLTGFSADPAGGIYRYVLIGKMCTLFVYQLNLGTSNATTYTMTAPFTSSSAATVWGCTMFATYDNSNPLTTPGRAYITASTTTITIQKDTAGNAWTASNGKRVGFTLTYEVA